MDYQVVTKGNARPVMNDLVTQIQFDIGRKLTKAERSSLSCTSLRLVDLSDGEGFWDLKLRASKGLLREIYFVLDGPFR